MSRATQDEKGKRYLRQMTVAHIREREGADHVDVVFLESARFYRLFKENPAYDDALTLLRGALADRAILEIGTPSIDSDIIEEVHERRPGTL